MDVIIELGQIKDIDELENLYNSLNDYLEKGINYPGWKRGVYPIRQDAIDGIKKRNLFIAKINETIVGAFILNHKPEMAYYNVKWKSESNYSEIFVIHTFVVHPNFMKCNIGKSLIDFTHKYSIESKVKSIRLDVYEGNIPAIKLYEKCGFEYIDTVDLGLEQYGLNWFKLYERLV